MPDKTKVIEFIPILNMGGAESMVKDYCLLMDKDKFDIKVVVMAEHYHTPIEQELLDAGIEIIFLGEMIYKDGEKMNLVKKVIRYLGRYYYFRKIILAEKPDVIHCHLHIGRYLRFIPLKRFGGKLFLTVHNVTGRYFSKDNSDRSKYTEYKEVNRLIHKFGMQLVALHDSMNKDLREYFVTDNVVTIHNGIRTKRFNPVQYDRNIVRKQFDISPETLVIGNIGRLHKQKNHELILDIFKEVSSRVPDSKLILVGTGVLEDDIRKKLTEYDISQKVIMLTNRDDIPELMHIMDAFLFPSLWEGFGNVLIEAQCMGLPCIVSNAIPADAIISDLVTVMDLNESIQTWSDEVLRCARSRNKDFLNNKQIYSNFTDYEEFDICNSVRKLEVLYTN